MVTSRHSPRCAGSGKLVEDKGPGTIVDCPGCGRPVRLMKAAFMHGSRVPSHGTVVTRNTKAADLRMSHMRELGL